MFFNLRSVVAAAALLTNGFVGFLFARAHQVDSGRYDFSETFGVDEDCQYRLEVSMKHDDDLPLGDPSTCVPGVIADVDGLPYLAAREDYNKLSAKATAATGFDHFSIDYNPCGHPPLENFGRPHYDLHFYRRDLEYRETMTCDLAQYAPICDNTPGAQTTPEGEAFFAVDYTADGTAIRNMPANFVDSETAKIPNMGGHAYDAVNVSPVQDWTDPVFVMGPYDNDVVHVEPMVPVEFVTGPVDKTWEVSPAYVEQTIPSLPAQIGMYYDAGTGYTTIVLEGNSDVCKIEKAQKKNKKKKSSKQNKKVNKKEKK